MWHNFIIAMAVIENNIISIKKKFNVLKFAFLKDLIFLNDLRNLLICICFGRIFVVEKL